MDSVCLNTAIHGEATECSGSSSFFFRFAALGTTQQAGANDESPKDEPEVAVGTKCCCTAGRIVQIHRIDLQDETTHNASVRRRTKTGSSFSYAVCNAMQGYWHHRADERHGNSPKVTRSS